MHGVSLSIGSNDSLDFEYLAQLKGLAKRFEPCWISDHLCWTGVKQHNLHDLLPLPYTKESIRHVVPRIKQVQDYLQQQILLENISSYVSYKNQEMTEWEFLVEVAEQSDSLILLDINNIFVNSYNNHFDPMDYIRHVPQNRVMQFHLAGHTQYEDYIVDTHDAPIVDPVWDLYAQTIALLGNVSTMIERDGHIPHLAELLIELEHARQLADKVKLERI